MKWSLYLGKIAGIKLFVHWTFMIIVIWIFWMYYRIDNSIQQGLEGVFFILALFACVTLHELGHALTARRYKIQTKNITLLPIGGLAQLERMPEKPYQELWVALAGPAVNVVIASILFIVLYYTGNIPTEITTEEQVLSLGIGFKLLIANVILAVFNLIPAFPMDGGRVLRALLSMRLDRGKATRIAATVGQILAIGFVFTGLFYNFFLIFIGIFIYLGAGAESAFETTKVILSQYKVRDALMQKFTRLAPTDTLEKAVQILLNSQEQSFIVMENEKAAGILTKNELIKGLSESGKNTPVADVMVKEFTSLKPEMGLHEAFQQLTLNSGTVSPVYENGTFIGIVDRENINELLLISQALKKNEEG